MVMGIRRFLKRVFSPCSPPVSYQRRVPSLPKEKDPEQYKKWLEEVDRDNRERLGMDK